jgi:hypothetical protein
MMTPIRQSARRVARAALAISCAAIATVGARGADELPAQKPRYKFELTIWLDKPDFDSHCTMLNGPGNDLLKKGKMSCGFPGKQSEIEWTFLGQHGAKDFYRFVRRFPSDGPNASTTTKEIEFADKPVTIFRDKVQIIEVAPPKPAKQESKRVNRKLP